jgi:hypothetical protein
VGLQQSECDFDGDGHWNSFPAWAHGGFKAPLPYGFHGFFFEAKARAFHNLDLRGAAVRRNHGLKNNRSLIFCFAGFF